jgi:hypothetical protein
MGAWKVDEKSEPGVLRLELSGTLTPDETRAFLTAHNRAIDGYRGRDYKVWCDLSALAPLSPECAALMEEVKRYSSKQPGFRGSAVLVSSATVSMQHRRTSVSGGVMGTELISDDAAVLREHLRTVYRRA